jgi:general secretion pathway protein H
MPVISATGEEGFTLLELLVVLTIIVLLAGAWPLAAPHLYPGQQLRNESQRLLSSLRAARTTARLTGSEQPFDIQRSGTAYRVATETRNLPTGLTLRLLDDAGSLRSVHLTFYPDGSSTGGTLDLAFPRRHVTVSVGRMTGRAEILN